MTRQQILKLCPNAGESFLKRNACPVGGVVRPVAESNQRRESEDQSVAQCQNRVGYCVSIISCRKKLLDKHDNLRFAHKALVDRVAEFLGFASDDDPLLTWEYSQMINERPGTIVKIQRL